MSLVRRRLGLGMRVMVLEFRVRGLGFSFRLEGSVLRV